MTNFYPISKTNFMLGRKCPGFLWFKFNQREAIPPLSPTTRAFLEEGHKVGELAHRLYPNGILIERDPSPEVMNEKSKEALKLGKPLFESGFLDEPGELYALPDILVPVGDNQWDLIEVKSTTEVKKEHYEDVAFQKFVYLSAEIKIRDSYLMHVNPEYVKMGIIEPEKFFHKENVNKQVDSRLSSVKKWVYSMLENINTAEPPEIKKNQSCSDCSLENECWKSLPELNVFLFYRGRKVAFKLREQGILDIKDLKDELKNPIHEIQRQALLTGKPYVDKEALQAFLSGLEYPLYFFDFETIASAIPIYDLSHPWEDIPFQFSVHVLKSPKATRTRHSSFLAGGDVDPRPEILRLLKKNFGNFGSIIAYNARYEKRCLEGMAEAYPEYKEWFEGIAARLVDLWEPFDKFYYYHPNQRRRTSMKVILPIFSKVTHKDLEITDGMEARLAYMCAVFDPAVSKDERQNIFNNLEKYCGLDTWGMIKILKGLIRLAT